MEWAFTIIFTIEYLIRIWIAKSASKYIFSFYGIIDLLAILPTFIGLFILNTHGLIVLRALRLLRMFRIFKLTRYLNASYIIMDALRRSKAKISVFLFAVIMVVLVIGTLMYMIEGGENGFTSIPRSVYWAIVTLTTVGYGDISPQTALGQFIASIVMILGYAIIAVPTGIVTSELSRNKSVKSIRSCNTCYKTGLDEESTYCKYCGSKLIE